MNNIEKLKNIKTEDYTYPELAEILGYSPEYTYRFLIKNEIKFRSRKKGGDRKSGMKPHPKTDRVIKLYQEGLSYPIIKERTGVADSTMYKIVRIAIENGLIKPRGL